MGIQFPSAVAWAELILKVLDAKLDPRAIDEWATVVAAAPRTLRNRCSVVGLPPKDSLDLARLLRAAHESSHLGCQLERLLDIRDPRTLSRLLARASLTAGQRVARPFGVVELLERQTLVADPICLNVLKRLLLAKTVNAEARDKLNC